jgi:hypothetical protein
MEENTITAEQVQDTGTQDAVKAETKAGAGEDAGKGRSEAKAADGGKAADSGKADSSTSTEKAEKTFTQSEVDELIRQRLARQAKQTAQSSEAMAKENTALKQVNSCYKAGIRPECIEDAAALAQRYVDDKVDFDGAIARIAEKYPEFLKKSAPRSTGVKTEEKSIEPDSVWRKAMGLKD